MVSNETAQNGTPRNVRFILFDINGPLAEFESWEEAFQFMAINEGHGRSIVRSEETPGYSAWPA
ncbi:MAG: hypothetical protein E6L09_13990 [Verrucomicrobia bacterium]|nr:MAG: hypothetical protein E6L09_13990 [Verrucomicrobiota bacterium]